MDRIRSISMKMINEYKSDFGTDFSDNKKALDKLSIIRSKGLKNEIAGFITKFIKHEIRDQKEKERREQQFNEQASDVPAETATTAETSEETADTAAVTETVVETADTAETTDTAEKEPAV